jgi:hypothetical protein
MAKKKIETVSLKKTDNIVDIHMHLTMGEAMAVKHALEMYKEVSCVAEDVYGYLEQAEKRDGIDLS